MKMPYVILKSAMSVDGFIDDTSSARLLLSNEADFDHADQVRAECDAILIGTGTLRADNPSLLIKSEKRQLDRLKRGLSRQPIKVTVTASGGIPDQCNFLSAGDGEKLIYCRADCADGLRSHLDKRTGTVVIAVNDLSPKAVLGDLYKRGVRKVLVEGGSTIATSFLSSDCVDELQLSIAPFFVGEKNAPRFTHPTPFPYRPNRPMHLRSVDKFDQVVLLTYVLDRANRGGAE